MTTSAMKENGTFSSAEPFQLNACVGTNGGPYDMSDYACGYFDAAKRVIESLECSRLRMDVLVYPVACMFRHAIELSIKHALTVFPPLWSEPTHPKLNHNLRANWQMARGLLFRTGAFDSDEEPLRRLDAIVADLVEIDPNGETFRYPTSKKGQLHLRDWKLINMQLLLEQIEYAENFFNWCEHIADGLWERRIHN